MLKSDENSESKEKSNLLHSSKKRKCKEMFLHLLQEQVHDNVELQQAVAKFKKTSEEEIKRLVKYEGVGIHDAIDAVVAKIRGAHGENFEANEEDVQLVMEVAGFHNKQDALRALIVREELVKLRLLITEEKKLRQIDVKRLEELEKYGIGAKEDLNITKHDDKQDKNTTVFEESMAIVAAEEKKKKLFEKDAANIKSNEPDSIASIEELKSKWGSIITNLEQECQKLTSQIEAQKSNINWKLKLFVRRLMTNVLFIKIYKKKWKFYNKTSKRRKRNGKKPNANVNFQIHNPL